MRDLTEDDIKCLVEDALQRGLPTLNKNAIRLKPLTPDEHEAALKDAEETTAKFKQLLGRSDYFPVEGYARAMLKKNDLHAPDGSLAFKELCHHLMKAGLQLSEADLKILTGDYPFEQPSPTKEKLPELPQDPLSSVIEQYANEQGTGKNWKPKSEFEVRSHLATLQEFLGDIPVSQIDHTAMREYKKALMKLPPNRSKMSRYRGKTIPELLAMNIKKPLSITSVNKYLRWASALFRWATRNGFMVQNPAEDMKTRRWWFHMTIGFRESACDQMRDSEPRHKGGPAPSVAIISAKCSP